MGGMLVFAGKWINEPIAWHGPFVMNTKAELRKAFAEYQVGKFPPVRCSWDYRKQRADGKVELTNLWPGNSSHGLRCDCVTTLRLFILLLDEWNDDMKADRLIQASRIVFIFHAYIVS